MSDTINTDIRKAISANVKVPLRVRIGNWVRHQGGTRLLFVALMLALLIGVTMLEATNSAKGWSKLMTGAIPTWLAFLAGFVVPLGYIGYHRRTMEHWRDAETVKAWRSAIVAILCVFLSLFGVFANISSETEKAAEDASKHNTERSELYAEIQAIKSRASDDRLFQLTALTEVTKRQIASVEAEAVGWNMVDTNPDGACAGDLRPRQRMICNTLNGDGGDMMGLRNELFLHESGLSEIERLRVQLAEMEKAYKASEYRDGGAHWSNMEKIASGKASGDLIRVWGSLIVALVFLLVAGFGWDEFFENAEKELGIDI